MTKRDRTNAALLALHVMRQARNLQRAAAAKTIQRRWKAALRTVNGTKKVHRSRVVQHRGRRYDARNLDHTQSRSWPNGTPMSLANQVQVAQRSRTSYNWKTHKNRRVKDQARAQKAFEKSANAFAPYQRAGWTPITVKYNGRSNMAQKTFVVPGRWSTKALREVLADIVERSDQNTWYLGGVRPADNNNNTPHPYVARWYRRR
jgi:hypothetical protein